MYRQLTAQSGNHLYLFYQILKCSHNVLDAFLHHQEGYLIYLLLIASCRTVLYRSKVNRAIPSLLLIFSEPSLKLFIATFSVSSVFFKLIAAKLAVTILVFSRMLSSFALLELRLAVNAFTLLSELASAPFCVFKIFSNETADKAKDAVVVFKLATIPLILFFVADQKRL